MTVPVVAIPPPNDRVELGDYRCQTVAPAPPRLRFDGAAQPLRTRRLGPVHPPLEVVAQEVEASLLSRINDPGFLGMQPQSLRRHPGLDGGQGCLGLSPIRAQ